MKSLSILLLFICVFAATFSKWCIITAFKINQHYIASELCVNKTNPLSHCNGHCYLSAQLNKEEKPVSPFASNSAEKFEIQLFCKALNTEEQLYSKQTKNNLTQPQNFAAQQYINLEFHPPKA